jgi:hypothetical protein
LTFLFLYIRTDYIGRRFSQQASACWHPDLEANQSAIQSQYDFPWRPGLTGP